MPSRINDIETLQAAVIGLQHQASEIDKKMAEIRARIGGTSGSASATSDVARPARKRVLSAAARRRIADAQRKRWAAFHKGEEAPVSAQKSVPTKPVTKKRKMSPAAKRRIAEATKKRWAAYRAAKATAAKEAGQATNKSVPAKKHSVAAKARKPAGKKSAPAATKRSETSAPETTTA